MQYDKAGRRVYSRTGLSTALAETYTYDRSDNVVEVKVDGITRMEASYDELGRLLGYLEKSGSETVYQRHSFVYSAEDQVLSERGRRKLDGNNEWHLTHTVNYFSDAGTGATPSAITGVGSQGTSTGDLIFYSETKNWLTSSGTANPVYQTSGSTGADGQWPDTYSRYTYEWLDPMGSGGARQTTHWLANRDGETLTTNTYGTDGSQQSAVTTVLNGTAATKTQSYTTDLFGRVLTRTMTSSNSGDKPQAAYYYFGGTAMGEVGNDGTDNVDFATMIARRDDTGDGDLRGGGEYGTPYAEFDLTHRTLASTVQNGTGSYTAKGGESLHQVAASVWGDANLWYKLAEANGLSATATLAAGQSIRIPAGVRVNTHNASTNAVYDPARALGDTQPTIPQPQKDDGCGVLGAVLLAVVAVAVTAIATAGIGALVTGAKFSTALSAVLGGGLAGLSSTAAGAASLGTVGAIGVAASGAAVGSIVSQGVGVATGIQEKFNWKGVGLAAISGGITGGLGDTFGSGITGAALRGAVSSAATQGIGTATGLQDKFSWAGVAAAGVGAGVGRYVGGKLGNSFGALLASNTAGAIANAATRSAINGDSFSRNLQAALPDVIGQTLGNAIADGVAEGGESDPSNLTEDAQALTGGGNQIQLPGRQIEINPALLRAFEAIDGPLDEEIGLSLLAQVRLAEQQGQIPSDFAGTVREKHSAVVQRLADLATANAKPQAESYWKRLGLEDGIADTLVPTRGSFAATNAELSLRIVKATADYEAGNIDRNVYDELLRGYKGNRERIAEWNDIADREVINLISSVYGGVDVARGSYRIVFNGEHTVDNYISAGGGLAGPALAGITKVGGKVIGRAAETSAPKFVPNPYGKLGGPDHVAAVDAVKADIAARGLDVGAEFKVLTPKGEKGWRFIDVVGIDPNTGMPVEFYQIGKQTKKALPVARERRAINDIKTADPKIDPIFIPYNK